jgi:hypothetical protein
MNPRRTSTTHIGPSWRMLLGEWFGDMGVPSARVASAASDADHGQPADRGAARPARSQGVTDGTGHS